MSIDHEIVLGEGVAIDSGAASVLMRAGSGAIDYIILVSGLWIGTIIIGNLLTGSNTAILTAVTIAFFVTWVVLVPALVETLTRGLSVGRLAVGLRIVRDDGGPTSARYALGRALVGVFEVFFTLGMVAAGVSFMSERGKRLGDMLVGTYAMRTRGGRTALPPIAMPFGLAGWAATADVRRLPDGLALTARLFLARAQSLSLDARYRLGTQLAEQLREYVAPPPPERTHPETFIAAVLATRRDREYAAGLRAENRNITEMARLSALPYGIRDVDN
ncbi:MAG: RDD family protein [Demequinaceae bacterium]|nr:RDD family protein [Demequinaceae bacterium]